jgi:hypothetical protein
MDYDLWIRMTDLGPIVHIPETLSQLRIYPEAKTSRGTPAMFDEYRFIGDRYGGYGLLNQMLWMLPGLLHKAMAALREGDFSHGQAWLTTVIANDPNWRSVPRLAEKLADEAWNKLSDPGGDLNATLKWLKAICRGLPEKYIAAKAVERRALGRLHAALAFQSFSQRNSGQTLRHVARAFTDDYGQLANRGLWAIALRSLARRLD